MELPTDGKWLFRYTLDPEQHVTVLFAMHQKSLEMLKHNPWVISMDCTYKTNRYNMPLLDIVGFTCTGASIYLGWAFIVNEREETYKIVMVYLLEMYEHLHENDRSFPSAPSTILTDKEPALINAVHAIFPSTKTIICIWHINMNVMKKALPLLRKAIADARDNGLIEWDGFSLPSNDHRLTKKELDEELAKILDQGWRKMIAR
ncbi:hypothetical protein N7532_009095 [Penicillium argentinense]|uniref:MULE transposase domain-containing protein n=1 Tax=Penicillium argentinense TaxID=1131581 RepID=A0A9W9EYW8_9EURO|nr:uncharacterized protein N7532_009095 [Penicillium argentinense]KAJ5090411.1 hypothetical protein N7532_009095 [Penicillium argentinense]